MLDFGLAKVTEREMRPGSIILTQEGMVFGTPEFMSPEQAQGKPLDARQRHLLARRHPLRGAHRQAAVRRANADGVHPAPRHGAADPAQRARARQDVPAGLGQAIAKALAKKPEDRYPSAAEFAAALKPFAGAARGHSGVMPAPLIPGVPLPAPVLRVEPTPKGRSSGLGLIVGVAAACLVMGVVLAVTVMRFLH